MEKIRVLIAEDEPIAALELKETLERIGCLVVGIVTGGDVVVESVGRLKPNLVIMDINLNSFIDGVDAAQRISLLGPISVIFVTAYSDPELRLRAMRTKPAGFLVKPVREEVLRDCVEAAIRKNE
ncbi:MAG: response regulator [Treponemataceae bacterium]